MARLYDLHQYFYFILLIFFFDLTYSQTDFWQQTNGPYGGTVYSFAIDSNLYRLELGSVVLTRTMLLVE